MTRSKAQAIVYAMLKQAVRDVIIRIARHLQKYDLIENANGFDGYMLMIRGERDKIVNQALEPTLAVMNKHGYFFIQDLKDAGHCANLDQPQIIRKIITDYVGSRTGRQPGSPEL